MKRTLFILAVAAILVHLGIYLRWPDNWVMSFPIAALGLISVFVVK